MHSLGARGVVPRFLSAALLALGLPLVVPTVAVAAPGEFEEKVFSYKVDITIREGGDLVRITERIGYDFGSGGDDHWFYRSIPEDYEITNVHAVALDGPDEVHVNASASETEIRIGDLASQQVLTGRHTYVISYDVDASLTEDSDHVEFSWDAVGSGWDVPVEDIAVDVDTPAFVTGVACYADEPGGTGSCASADASGQSALFAHPRLKPGQALTIEVRLPEGSVQAVPAPVSGDDDKRDIPWGMVGLGTGIAILVIRGIVRMVTAVLPTSSRGRRRGGVAGRHSGGFGGGFGGGGVGGGGAGGGGGGG